jgi:cytochrome c peroxidase
MRMCRSSTLPSLLHLTLLGVLILAAGCGPEQPRYDWALPAGFPEPAVPDDNPMTAGKVELGRHLFHDLRLSGNGTQACASCHLQSLAFSDGRTRPEGSTGHRIARNSPGLANVAWFSTYTWASPVLTTLESQALVPLFGEAPVELGLTHALPEVLGRLRAEPRYRELFAQAFPERDDPIHQDAIVQALASFQRTLISGASPYDRWVLGDSAALGEAAQRGHQLFLSERGECYHCHAGPTFSTSFRAKGSRQAALDFHNTGLHDVDGEGAYPPENTGLFEFTQQPEDMGRFRVPSLRNVALTAPYMHDGSIATLREVVDHYASPTARSRLTSPLVRPVDFTEQEREDLVAFLESLTDEAFTRDPRFASPWE